MISKPFLVLGALVAASSVSVGGYYIHKNISSKKKEPAATAETKNPTPDVVTPSAEPGSSASSGVGGSAGTQ